MQVVDIVLAKIVIDKTQTGSSYKWWPISGGEEFGAGSSKDPCKIVDELFKDLALNGKGAA